MFPGAPIFSTSASPPSVMLNYPSPGFEARGNNCTCELEPDVGPPECPASACLARRLRQSAFLCARSTEAANFTERRWIYARGC